MPFLMVYYDLTEWNSVKKKQDSRQQLGPILIIDELEELIPNIFRQKKSTQISIYVVHQLKTTWAVSNPF